MTRSWSRFENEYVSGQPTAQEYYEGREITERKPRFVDRSSYVKDYPAWELPSRERPKSSPVKPIPGRTGKTSYSQDYTTFFVKPHDKRPPELVPRGAEFRGVTSNAIDFPRWPSSKPNRVLEDHSRPWEERPFDDRTAYADAYKARPRSRSQQAQRLGPGPSGAFTGQTSYTKDYPKKQSVPTRMQREYDRPMEQLPFKAVTSYGQQFRGWKVPSKRVNLGVETVGDVFHVIISKNAPLPATGKYVFSTHRNNQQTACILVLAGCESLASHNKLLGQFDMVNIPPQPRQVPAIEVKFTLSADHFLTVEARDPDTKRHKAWVQNRGAVVVR